MNVKIIQQRLDALDSRTGIEEQQAIREITQEIVLAALSRGDFFKHAVFQGGTCLRIFHGLNRFSEDLDFILLKPNPEFRLSEHVRQLRDELSAFGYDAEIVDRAKADSAVKTAFIKDSTISKRLDLRYPGRSGPAAKIRIKLEVDTNPPSGTGTKLEYMDFPYVAAVTAQDMPSLLAGKIHALLCRPFTKGRDWYDFIWYTSRGVSVNERFLSAAIHQLGPWQGEDLVASPGWVVKQLREKILSIDWKHTAEDVRPFVRASEQPSLALWNEDLFLHQLEKWARDVGAI